MPLITINGIKVESPVATSILDAARGAGIYVPVLCSHPDLKPFHSIELTDKVYQHDTIYYNDPDVKIDSIRGCGLCIVEVEGESKPIPSCKTQIADGMVIHTETELIRKKRKENLIPIMATHPHSCLTCVQREGCAIISGDCSNSVVLNERCCEITGNCEIQRIADYIGIAPETPKYHHQGIPRIEDCGLFIRDYNLCIACGRCVRACQQLRGVYALGAVIKNGKLLIGTTKGTYLSEADCRFCGTCVEVCPTGAIQDKRIPRLKELKDYVPCKANCPAGVDVPTYLRLIAEGSYQKSANVISSRLSFPNALGKVCFHPCETDCRRNKLLESLTGKKGAVNIRSLKDFAMTHSDGMPVIMQNKDSGKRIAIIGAGPAGLTAGFYLSLNGHQVIIYEKENDVGGMLRYGIPRYRLPLHTLERDIEWIKQSGMEFRTNVEIGKYITISSLLNDGYDAVLLSIGLSHSKKLNHFSSKSSCILFGIEFLNSTSKGKYDSNYFVNKEIIVIGGGNVATDAARTAIRLSAANVKIICLEKETEMPAYKQEIADALDEGIEIQNGWGIADITDVNENILKIDLKKCTNVFDEQGRFNPAYDDSITGASLADYIILCIGQEANLSGIANYNDISLSDREYINTKSGSHSTQVKGLFAAGDIVSGPASVIDAVGAGKQAAREIDIFLGGNGIISGDEEFDYRFNSNIGRLDGFSRFERMPVQLKDISTRIYSFDPVEIGYGDSAAGYEASRCLQCNLRLDIKQNPHPPEKYLEFNQKNIETIPTLEGVVQLLDKDKEVFIIKGSDNIRDTLLSMIESGNGAKYFTFEYDKLFSKRESELIGQYLHKHGKMPDSGDNLDDLF